jgi:NAD(P)-dependent dehydrogenase (short-subunit alcohol dehydrogenase family)
LADQAADADILVNNAGDIGGGTIDSMTGLSDESRYRELTAHYPLGRPAEPREIADLVAFLASNRSSYTSGAVFTVDGGASSAASLY